MQQYSFMEIFGAENSTLSLLMIYSEQKPPAWPGLS